MSRTITCSRRTRPTRVREFVEEAFGHVDLDWKKYVKHDARYERPPEVDLLIGDPAKAKKQLGWEPKVRFKELVQIMVDADLAALSSPAAREQLGKLRYRYSAAASSAGCAATATCVSGASAGTIADSGAFKMLTRAPTRPRRKAAPRRANASGYTRNSPLADVPLLGRCRGCK